MIKRFIKKIGETSTDAMVAVLDYIDRTLDEHNNRLNRHKDRMNKMDDRIKDLEDDFKPVKTTVESNSNKKAGYVKIIVNTALGAVILYILSRLGIG